MSNRRSIGSRTVTGIAWLTIARIVSAVFAFLTTVVVARILTPADFGLVVIGTTVSTIIASISAMSLAEAVVQHPNPTRDVLNTAWTCNLIRSVIIAALCATLAYPVAGFFEDERIVPILLMLATGVSVVGLENPRMALVARDLVFWPRALGVVTGSLVNFAVSVAIAFWLKSYWALVFGLVAAQITITILSYALLSYRPSLDLSRAKELMSFSGWVMLGQFINTLSWNFDQLLVGKAMSLSQLGQYRVGNQIAFMPTREAMSALQPVLFPALTKFVGEREVLAQVYQRAQTLLTALVLPAGVGLALIAEPLIYVLLGEQWQASAVVVQILAPVFAIQTIGNVAQALAMAAGKTKSLFLRDTIAAVFRLLCIITGAYYFGFIGILWARALIGVTAPILSMLVAKHVAGIGLVQQLWANRRTFIAILIMVCATLPVTIALSGETSNGQRIIDMIVIGAVGALSYTVSLFLLWYFEGRPNGPEQEIQKAARFGLTKFGLW
jgi:O-antigen/teichoic acid export membrane protein